MRPLLLGAVAPAILFLAADAMASSYGHSWCTGVWNAMSGSCYIPPPIPPQTIAQPPQKPPVVTQVRPPEKVEAPPRLTLPGGGGAPQPGPGTVATMPQSLPPQPIVAPPRPAVVVTGPQPVPQPLPRVVTTMSGAPVSQPGGAVLPQLAPGGVVQQVQSVQLARPVAVPPLVTPQQGGGPVLGPAAVQQVATNPALATPALPPGQGASVTVRPAASEPALAPRLVTHQAGRQALHAQPHFAPGAAGGRLNCIASGHGQRLHVDENGVARTTGQLPGFVVMSVAFQDIPASHQDHAECLIAVRRRDPGPAGVR